jgi:hypothetical protein
MRKQEEAIASISERTFFTNPFLHCNYEAKFVFGTSFLFFSFFLGGGLEGRHANAKVQEAIHHLTSFPSSREEIS